MRYEGSYLLVGGKHVDAASVSDTGLNVFVLELLLECFLHTPFMNEKMHSKEEFNKCQFSVSVDKKFATLVRTDPHITFSPSYQKHPAANVAFSEVVGLLIENALGV